jgi:hypothetical protein
MNFIPVSDLATTSAWASVLNLAWTSMVIVKSWRSEETDLSSRTIKPPPSTVSIVRANRFGVRASKSYSRYYQSVTAVILT